jgi:IS5 family transposase
MAFAVRVDNARSVKWFGMLVDGLQRLMPSFGDGDDRFGVGLPRERVGRLVVVLDEAVDRLLQRDQRGEGAALQATPAEPREEALDRVQPRARGTPSAGAGPATCGRSGACARRSCRGSRGSPCPPASAARSQPDANTIWTFHEALARSGAIQRLFALFDRELRAKGYLAMSGQLVDASVVSAPKQRMTKAEKQAIKEGRIPEDWQAKPAMLRQKDLDARWTVKTTKPKPRDGETPMVDLAIPEFGYQNHISTDRRHRLIRRWLVSDAAAHAGARLADLLDPGNTASGVWADTGYRSRKNEDLLRQRMLESHIHRKKPRGRPMPDRTSRASARKSAVRPDRARLRRAEGQDGPVRPEHRPRPRDDQNRARQSGPQHAPPDLAPTTAAPRDLHPRPVSGLIPSPTVNGGVPLRLALSGRVGPDLSQALYAEGETPARRMISAVPQPSPVARMIRARQTCFCGLLRSATTRSSRSTVRGAHLDTDLLAHANGNLAIASDH